MRSGRTRCSRRHELSRRYRRCPIAESPCRSTSRRHDCATPGHPTDAGPQPRTRPEKAAKHIRVASAPPTDPPPPELPLPALDPPPELPPPPLGTAEPPPSPPPRGTAEPVVFPLDVRSCAEAILTRQTGDRERHGTGDEISLTSHNASEHVCRRTAEPTSTQQACQTRWSEYGLFSDSTPLAGCQACPFQSPCVLYQVQEVQGFKRFRRFRFRRFKSTRGSARFSGSPGSNPLNHLNPLNPLNLLNPIKPSDRLGNEPYVSRHHGPGRSSS